MAVLETDLGTATIASTLGITDYPLTIACWIRLDNSSASNEGVAEFYDTAETTDNYISIRKNTTDKLAVAARYANGTELAASAGTGISALTWTPVVGRFTQTSREVFLNTFANSGSQGTDIGGFSGVTNPINGFRLGDARGSSNWDGKIAHVAVWDKALTDTEVTAFLEGRNPLATTGDLGTAVSNLRAYWAETIEDDGGTNYYRDETGNNYDLTLGAGAVVDTTTAGPTVDAPPATENSGIVIADIKEANLADQLVTGVSNVRAVVWIGTTETSEASFVLENQTITEGAMTLNLTDVAVGSSYVAIWSREVSTGVFRYGRATGTVVDLDA